MAYPTFRNLQDDSAVNNGCKEEPELSCPHCDEKPTFAKKKEFNRHMKVHDPDAILWHCGCCQNLGDSFEPKVRKDKVQTHLRKIHDKPKSEDNKGIRCPQEGCYTLFTAASCLHEHWIQTHSTHLRGLPSQTANGE